MTRRPDAPTVETSHPRSPGPAPASAAQDAFDDDAEADDFEALGLDCFETDAF